MVEDTAISIVPLEASVRLSLRLREEAAADLRGVAGFDLQQPISRCVEARTLTSARLGPDEWWLLGAEADRQRVVQELGTGLAGTWCSLVDISHRNAGIAVAGTFSREVINGGCPLDLDDSVFPAGSATRTLLGKAEIVLLRPGLPRNYRIECGRSFAPYVHAFLKDVAREFQRA